MSSFRRSDVCTRHFWRKLRRVSRMTCGMFMAQMFGTYRYSSYSYVEEFDYARYFWRGQHWIIPVSCSGGEG